MKLFSHVFFGPQLASLLKYAGPPALMRIGMNPPGGFSVTVAEADLVKAVKAALSSQAG